MEQLGQHLLQVLVQQESQLGGAGTQFSSFSFWWLYYTFTAATEEWTGAGAAVTKTITVS
jgi:hypothetical protein